MSLRCYSMSTTGFCSHCMAISTVNDKITSLSFDELFACHYSVICEHRQVINGLTVVLIPLYFYGPLFADKYIRITCQVNVLYIKNQVCI